MAKEELCKSKNQLSVFIDLKNSNLRLHTLETPNLIELIKFVVENSILEGEKVALQHEFDKPVGTTSMVQVDESDEIVWAKRLDRDDYSKFVKNRQAKACDTVVVVLFRRSEGYLVWSGWCGELLPQEPDGVGGMRTSREFKDRHAMVFDPKIIQRDTISSVDPR